MLDCRLSFEIYAKNIRYKATKCSLKAAEALLDVYDKFDINHGTTALNCFNSQ